MKNEQKKTGKARTAESLAEREKHNELLDAKEASLKLELQHGAQIRSLGTDLLTAVIGVGEKYLTLCTHIRQNGLAP